MEKVHTFVSGGKRYPVEDTETSEALAREAERSQAADIKITEQIALLNNSISGEKLRAEGAERNLQTAINDEAARAADAEKFISVALQTEKDRAKEAENTLDEKIKAKHNEALDALDKEVEAIKDGDTIAGQAREVYSRTGKTVTDSFLARTTAGSGTVGDGVASLKSVGGNIVKNLVDGTFESGWTTGITNKENNIITVVPPSNYDGARYNIINVIPNHKYYAAIFTSGENNHLLAIIGLNSDSVKDLAYSSSSSLKKWGYLSTICTNNADYTTLRMRIGGNGNKGLIYVTKPIFIDLTEMFGAGKEPSKEECDRLFGTMDALPQGLSIAKPTEFKSVGYNQFNPENVLKGKTIDENGAIVDSTTTDIAVIPCLPCKVGTGENNGYCVHGEFEDSDIKVYLTPLNPMEIEGELYMHELTSDATKGTYVPLIKGYMLVVVPTTVNLCCHFLWGEDRDKHDYEPYHESKVELPVIPQMSEWGLAGIQSSGTLACDEIDFERGVYRKKIKDAELSQHGWWAESASNLTVYYADLGSKINGVKNVLSCERYTLITFNALNLPSMPDKSMMFSGRYLYIRDNDFATNTAFRNSLTGLYAYYAMATPEEYPLPKVDNNYISSDYGVEKFNSVVPCNANNLYYMRSLAGETKNFLDRMYDNTEKTDAKEVADYITSGIESNKELATNAPNLALRSLYIAAGATYNESTGFYKVDDLDDVTEAEMAKIYAGKDYINNLDKSKALAGSIMFRTMIPTIQSSAGQVYTQEKPISGDTLCSGNTVLEIFKITTGQILGDVQYVSTMPYISARMNQTFYRCTKLKFIYPINLSLVNYNNNTFGGCVNLTEVRLYNIKISVSFSDSLLISKDSIIWIIKYAKPTSAITITLHADAYNRLANDADIVAALEAQPLVTLVSA